MSDEQRVTKRDSRGNLRTYIVRGTRVSALSMRNGREFEMDLTSASERRHDILKAARRKKGAGP
jgi:hypothetical protein